MFIAVPPALTPIATSAGHLKGAEPNGRVELINP